MGTGGDYSFVELVSCFDEASKLDDSKHSNLPQLKSQKFRISVPRMRLRTSTLEAKHLVKKMREQTTIVVALWPQQFEITRRLEREVKQLQQKLLEDEMEIMDMKRKRWCRVCEKEATYIDKHKRFFFCSERCENVHQEQQRCSKSKENPSCGQSNHALPSIFSSL